MFQRIFALALLALAPASAFATSDGPPPPWNRRLVAVEIAQSFPTVPGRYDVSAAVLFARGDGGSGALNLSTRFDVFREGHSTPVATSFASVSFGPTGPSCGPQGCENGWLCASLNVEGVVLIGDCRVYPPHGGDDAPWCQCSGVTDIPIAQQIVLDPGDKITVVLSPAPGAAPEPYTPDDPWITSVPPSGISSFCFGLEHQGPCPCGNFGYVGQGCANSQGVGAVLSATGSTSAAADDLIFETCNIPPPQPVLLFSGHQPINGGNGVPFGDGLRCAGTATIRIGTEIADAQGCASWGPGLAAQFGWTAGEVVYLQDWYRDPHDGPCDSGFNLSNALEVHISP